LKKAIKKYSILTILCFLGILSTNTTHAQSAHKHLREGDGLYLRKNYKQAELSYRNAQEAERSYKGSFNLGNSLYMQQRHDDALQIYDDVAKRAIDNDMRSQAYYNQGNTHIQKSEYDKAVESYKQSLRLNPNDEDAKKNLAFAKKMQKEQQKNQKNQDKNQQQQPQNQPQNQDKNQQQQPQNQPQNQDKNQPQPPQNQPQNQDKNEENNQKQPQQQPNMSKENAERLLQIMDNEDQKVQQRLKKGKPSKKTRSNKDW
jgi:Ca-activated chloride channel homolog